MQIAIRLDASPLCDVPSFARMAEETGCDVLLAGENRFDGFLPLVLAAEHTERVRLGPNVAIAFPRSPMVVASLSWDLQRFSRGRFLLGLGTQVKGHIERRFGGVWTPPVPRLREYIRSLRAIWDCFQNGKPLDFRGEHYTFNLMTPHFNPGPIDHPHVPVFIGAVNPLMCRLAGEVCDGLFLHTISSPKYTQEVVWPSLREGAQRAGRSLDGFGVMGGGFIVAGHGEAEIERGRRAIKQRIAFYASTRTYTRLLEVHGWGDLTAQLHPLSRQGKWEAMTDLITDEMVDTFAVSGTYGELGRKLRERWAGRITTVIMSVEVFAAANPDERRQIVLDIHGT